MDFRDTSVEALASQVRTGERSAIEVTQAALDRITAIDPAINAFVSVNADLALTEAQAVDDRIAEGEEKGLLAGVPIGVKDLEDAAGFVTTQGSLVYAHDGPAATDSILVARLRAAGCVVVGKTNTPEMGAKGQTSNRVSGITRNPWDLSRTPGGSSGGSAAAVAAGMVPLTTGSDGGGSIRIPASLCGLTGFKPSIGRVPVGGAAAPAWGDLSSKGPMTARIRDTAFVLDAVVGPDPTDLRSLPRPDVSWRAALEDVHPPARVAWSPTLGYSPVDSEVLEVCRSAVDRLSGLGTRVDEEDSVFPVDPVMVWMTLTSASNLWEVNDLRDTPQWDMLDETVRMTADYASESISALDVLAAEDACHEFNLTLVELFRHHSLLLTPTVAAKPPPVDTDGILDGRPDPNWIRFTYPFNLTRSPAGTVCVGFTSEGLPVGLQVIGPQHADVAVLRLLALLEDTMAIDRRAPDPA